MSFADGKYSQALNNLSDGFLNLQKTGWLSVPQFGEWDQKTPSETNYSVVFSQARANRRHHKSDLTHRSYDFEQELLCREREQAARVRHPKLKKIVLHGKCIFNTIHYKILKTEFPQVTEHKCILGFVQTHIHTCLMPQNMPNIIYQHSFHIHCSYASCNRTCNHFGHVLCAEEKEQVHDVSQLLSSCMMPWFFSVGEQPPL